MKGLTTINHSSVRRFEKNQRLTQIFRVLLAFAVLAHTSFASPLVFKVSKNISSKEYIELGSFDASKLRQIRINLKVLTPSGTIPISKESAERELASAKSQFNRTEKLLKDGVVSKGDFDSVTARLNEAQDMVENAFSAEIVGVVDGDEVTVLIIDEKNLRTSIVIDVPPAAVKVKVRGKGSFSFYAWGQ